MRNLLRVSEFVAAVWNVGATAQVKFKVLPFRVKIQGLALIGCASNDLVEGIVFESGDYLQGEDPRSLIGRRRRWCTVSFLEASLLEYLTSGVVLVVVVLLM